GKPPSDAASTHSGAPGAHVVNKPGTSGRKRSASPAYEAPKTRRETATGAPRFSSRHTSEDDEFDHISVTGGLHKASPKSTFLGMGATLAAIDGSRPSDPSDEDGDIAPEHHSADNDRTAVVGRSILDQIREGSSAA